jgi:hypothetical protein
MRFLLLTLCLGFSVVCPMAASVTLAWEASECAAVYRVSWGSSSRAYEHTVETTNCAVTLANVKQPAFFAVQAVNVAGVAGGYSEELRWPALPRAEVVIIAERSTNLAVWTEERRWTNAVSGSNAVWRLRIQ